MPHDPFEQRADFERVALSHLPALVRVARRLALNRPTAEDLVQETFLLAWRSFHQFQPGTNAKAWLFRILLNAFYAAGRKAKAAPEILPFPDIERSSGGFTRGEPDVLAAAEVGRALAELSLEHRTVLLLGVVEGFTCEEMAEILKIPVGTVMSRVSRARRALRQRLGPGWARTANSGEAACAHTASAGAGRSREEEP